MDPVWENQICFFPLPSLADLKDHDCRLKCVVRDFDEDGSHDFLGQVELEWNELLSQITVQGEEVLSEPASGLRPRRASVVDLFNSASADVAAKEARQLGTEFRLQKSQDPEDRQIVKGQLGVKLSRSLYGGHEAIIHPRMVERLVELVYNAELKMLAEVDELEQPAAALAQEMEKTALHLIHLMTSTRPRIRRLFECSAHEPNLSIPLVLQRVAKRYGESPMVTSLMITLRTATLQWQAKKLEGVETDENTFAKTLMQYNKMTSGATASRFRMLASRVLTMLDLYLNSKIAFGQQTSEEGIWVAVTAVEAFAADVGVNETACKVLRRLIHEPHDWESVIKIGGLRSKIAELG